MVLALLLVLLGAAAFFCVLLAPLSIIAASKGGPFPKGVSIRFSWGHPLLLEGAVDLHDNKVEVRLLRKFRYVFTTVKGAENATAQTGVAVQADLSAGANPSGNTSAASSPSDADSDASGGNNPAEPVESAAGSSSCKSTNNDDGATKEGRKPVVRRFREFIEGKFVRTVMFYLCQYRWYVAMFAWALRRVRAALRLVSLRFCIVDVRAGMDDPAATGRIFGAWMGFKYGLPVTDTPNRRLSLTPVFDRQCFEITGNVCLQTSLARFVWLALASLVAFPYVTTFMVWRKYRKVLGAVKVPGKRA